MSIYGFVAFIAPPITVMVTANLNTPLIVGQIGNTLTCDTSGTDSLSPAIAYQWTRNDGSTQTQVGSSKTLTLPSLTLSGAGEYSCSATVGSALLTSDIEASAVTPQRVEIQGELLKVLIVIKKHSYSVPPVPDPQSVIVTSSGDSIVRNGSTVTVICTVELGPAILPSEVPLLLVSAWLFKNGAPLTVTALTMTGTTYNFGTMVSSFSERDIGNYTCTATISPQPSSTFLTGMGYGESNNVEIVIGKTIDHELILHYIWCFLYIGIPPIAGPDGNALSGDSSNTS